MQTRIKKWGNSLGVRIPQSLAASAGVKEDMDVDLSFEGETIMIRPVHRKATLKELVSKITTKNRHEETDWGGSSGKEIW